MKDKLVIFESKNHYRIGWYLPEEADMGMTLGEDLTSILVDSEEDHIAATMALKNLESTSLDSNGFYWESKSEANKALAIAKQAIKNISQKTKVETASSIPWIKASECPPPVSDAMVTRKVLVWYEGQALFGRYLKEPLNEWRLDGCNFGVEIEYYALITDPTVTGNPIIF
jgi:hypothetical protein